MPPFWSLTTEVRAGWNGHGSAARRARIFGAIGEARADHLSRAPSANGREPEVGLSKCSQHTSGRQRRPQARRLTPRRQLLGFISYNAERTLRFRTHACDAGRSAVGSSTMPSTNLMISKCIAAPTLATVALGLIACGGSTPRSSAVSSRPTTLYTVSMSGTAETSNGAPQGRGVAIIAFRGATKVCFRFAHLHGFVGATVAHVHFGTIGHSGPVVVALSSGPKLQHRGCRTISPVLSRAIWRRPSAYYVNVHSRRYPVGAVRAQL
jgi:hypothetical protein